MSDCLDCPVYLRGLNVAGAGHGPTILARTDHNFIQGILDTVGGAGGPAALANTVARVPAGESHVKLYQPLHRTFNVAVLEAGCDTFGDPRLDPARIESAGLVMRRLGEPDDGRPAKRRGLTAARKAALSSGGEVESPRALAEAAAENVRGFLEETTGVKALRAAEILAAQEQLEGWAQMGAQLRGWTRLTADELDLDPDPARRRPQLRAGIPLIDAMLSAAGGQPRAEAVAPLFVAPPEVCQAAGKTVLYGLIPVTSAEQTEAPETLPPFPTAAVEEHLSPFLRNTADMAVPLARQQVDFSDARSTTMAPFVNLLRQLAIELDAFSATPTPAAQALLTQLNQVRLPFIFAALSDLPGGAFANLIRGHIVAEATLERPIYAALVPAGDFLSLAVPVLVERQGEAPGDPVPALLMPDHWPALSPGQRQGILDAITRAMTDRLAPLASKAGRYDEVGRRYRLRAFIRVKGKPGCPPTIVWSEPSAVFTIAPWYESGDAPPVQVRLPDPTDRNFLKKVKPNVAFVMPEGLFNMLNRSDPKDLQSGSAQTGGPSIGLQWICSFSIPIITLCAFIVLYIFLTLFDLIFRWLLFIKICIPFPKPR